MTSRLTPPVMRRAIAACSLAAVLASAAMASASTAPYSISDIGPAPVTGFKVSDIGGVPAFRDVPNGAPDPPPPAYRISDITPR